jgi:NAD-reducing hydrogenase large subunit
LSSPDLLFGFGSDMAQRNIVGVAAANPEVARQGVLLRKYGQEVIRHTAGKRVHGTNKNLSLAERDELLKDIYQMIGWARGAVHLMRQRLHEQNPALYDAFGSFRSNMLSAGARRRRDGPLRRRPACATPTGAASSSTTSPARTTWDLIEEEGQALDLHEVPLPARAWARRGWYRVGPLARVQNCDFIPTPRAERERQRVRRHGQAAPGARHAGLPLGAHDRDAARHGGDRRAAARRRPSAAASDLVPPARQERGVGVIEAPRGTLIHHYRVGDDDLVIRCAT